MIKGTSPTANHGSWSSMVEIVGAHEYTKSRWEFSAYGPLCALWATSKFVGDFFKIVDFIESFNVI